MLLKKSTRLKNGKDFHPETTVDSKYLSEQNIYTLTYVHAVNIGQDVRLKHTLRVPNTSGVV